MSFLEILESTAFSEWVLTSMLGFPTLIAVHSIGMAVAAGLTIVVTLYLNRFIWQALPMRICPDFSASRRGGSC